MIKIKTSIYTIKGESKGEIELPTIFESEIRDDILKKAFRASQLSARHPYGSSPLAGSRRVGHTTGPGQGVSRMPRVSGSSRGVLLGNTVGGRSPHSPRLPRKSRASFGSPLMVYIEVFILITLFRFF